MNCRTAAWGCIDCKKVLAANMSERLAPMRERSLALRAAPETLRQVLGDGAATARRLAAETMTEVTARMGFLAEGA